MADDAYVRSLIVRIQQLEAQAEAFAQRLAEVQQVDAILARTGGTPLRAVPPSPRHKRDRHGLHLVPGFAAAAMLWVLRSPARKAATLATALAMAGATVTGSAVLAHQPAEARERPAPAVTATWLPPDPAAIPILAARDHDRVIDDDDWVDREESPEPVVTPTPAPTASPTPTPVPPSPSPTPSATPPAGP